MTHNDDFEFVVTETPTGNASLVASFDLPDATTRVQQLTGAVNTFTVQAGPISLGGPPITLESLTPFQCTIDVAGRVSKGTGGDGLCVIAARSAYGLRTLAREMRTVGADSVGLGVDSYKAGSLAAHVHGLLVGYYAGRTPTLMQMHLHELNRRQWRANRIAPNLDMSWQSVDASDGPAFPCSLISPRHALCCAHAGFGVGRRYLFLTPAGSIVEATAKRIWHGGSDLGLVYFDTPVIGCGVAKIAPNLKEKTSLERQQEGVSFYTGYEFPALITAINSYFLPQEVYGGRKLMPVGLNSLDSWPEPKDATLAAFAPYTSLNPLSDIRGGDSGSAVFFPVLEPGQTAPTSVLVSACYSARGGPSYTQMHAAISAAMNTIKDPEDLAVYAVQQADLSAFPSYP